MSEVNYAEGPIVSDIVVFDLEVKNSEGDVIDPYEINKITIYFVERSHAAIPNKAIEKIIDDKDYTDYYSQAVPFAIFGDDTTPVWLSTDTSNAFVERIEEGIFRLKWDTQFGREGDYILCYSWIELEAGDQSDKSITFYLSGNTAITTAIPSHQTSQEKYPKLFDRYMPDMFNLTLGDSDLTPQVLSVLNSAIAKGFTGIEDLVNQLVDLLDANVVNADLLPYLGNLFDIQFKSSDVVLWRRQVKEAIPLYKKKGTLLGLKGALSAAGMTFKGYVQLWQVASPWTFTESFKVKEDQTTFKLTKLAILPETDNFSVSIRLKDEDDYEDLTLDYVIFNNENSETIVTWVGDSLSINPIALEAGDIVKIKYVVFPVESQSIEDYIQSLPVQDRRDEADIDYPLKNWNVRVIEDTDEMFDTICPSRHPFEYPVVWGRIRTEFPYSENIYNMEEWNGSSRDSISPCDVDKNFLDSCSCCLGSSYNLEVEISNITNDRISEVEDILKDFTPFQATPFTVSYSGSQTDFFISPEETIEILGRVSVQDSIIEMQMSFNRLIEYGNDYSGELNRSMVAELNVVYTGTGTGSNEAVTLYSPGVRFDTAGVNLDSNYLEILSGTYQGEYSVTNTTQYTADIVGSISFPLDTSEFPFRLSNIIYTELAAVYQDDEYYFYEDGVSFIAYGVMDDWKVVVTSGIYAGTYEIESVMPDDTLKIIGFPAIASATGLSYQLKNASNITVLSSSDGIVQVDKVGRVEIDLIAEELGMIITDFVKIGSTQYRIKSIIRTSVDNLYIQGYDSGDMVPVNIIVYRRILDTTGHLEIRGMILIGTIPTVSYELEDNQFLENYLISVGSNYYKIEEIDGSSMFLSGVPLLEWGNGTSVDYSIVQLVKTSPIETQGVSFDFLDRRGNERIDIDAQSGSAVAGMFGNDFISHSETIWIDVERR